MTNRAVISSPDAPQAIGPYSQAVKVGSTVWLSGQIPLDPDTMELPGGDVAAQTDVLRAALGLVHEVTEGGALIDYPSAWPEPFAFAPGGQGSNGSG